MIIYLGDTACLISIHDRLVITEDQFDEVQSMVKSAFSKELDLQPH